MNRDYDVIVVGAGPGGSTAARFCARAGLKTLLVEKDSLPRYKPCGGCLSLKAMRLIGFDLGAIVENAICQIKFTYRLRDPIFIRSNSPVAYMVMRDRFDHFLVERALEEGATLVEGEKVIKVIEQDGGIEVELAKGSRFRCDCVVGADGADSFVGRSFALSPPRGNGWGIAVESEIPFGSVTDFPKEQHDLIHLDFGGVPNGYGWVFPKREWLSIGIGGMFTEGEKMHPRHYYANFVKELRYLGSGETQRIVGHPLTPFYSETQKVSQGKVILVGDAAHLMDPLMGEGIYYAVRSGMLAAESIVQSKENGIPSSDLYQMALRTHLFDNLKWALHLSRLIFPLTKLAYQTFKRFPELADSYLQVLGGKDTYQGFVTSLKHRMNDLLKGQWGARIRKIARRA